MFKLKQREQHMNKRLLLSSMSVAFWSLACVTPAHSESTFFSGRYKINCTNSPDGCACTTSPESTEPAAKVFHAQPVEGSVNRDATLDKPAPVELKVDGKKCFYPSQKLRPIYWDSDLCPNPDAAAGIPFRPMSELLTSGNSENQKIALGSLFPTFYNIADESFHPGPKVVPLYEAVSGKLIARVSKSFHEDLDMEGTGRLVDGRVLNVANYVNGIWDYKILPSDAFGIGILGHNLHPYRSVAVDFAHLCKQGGFSFCDQPISEIKKRLIGTLLYMPRLRGIPLGNGKVHDGYVCAQDVGGAIEFDRVDLFVGPIGGGNPYLKDCRQGNPLIDAGIQGLNPTDWRTYEANGFDDAGKPKFKRTKEFEYRIFGAKKALETYIVKDAFCKP
jgi:hypothetical protein